MILIGMLKYFIFLLLLSQKQDIRTRLLSQLKELVNLKNEGILTEDEFLTPKDKIIEDLHKL